MGSLWGDAHAGWAASADILRAIRRRELVVSLSHELATLVLEVLGVFGAVALLVALTVGRRPKRAEVRFASAAVVGALTLALAVGEIPSGVSVLIQAHRLVLSSSASTDYCFFESWPDNPGGAGQARLGFVDWLKDVMGSHAVYAIDYAPPPDQNCLFLGLLPALPAAPGEHADWTIAFGVVPAEMQARIAAHDPSVQVFAPGFALQQVGKR